MKKQYFLFLLMFILGLFSVSANCNTGCCNCTTYTVNGTFIDTYNNETNRTEHIWTEGNFTKTDCVGSPDSHLFEILFGIVVIIGFFLFLAFKLDETHKILKTLFLLISVYLGILIPRVLAILTNAKVSADLLKYYNWVLVFFTWYLFFYFIWSIADYYNKTNSIKKWFKGNFGKKGGNDET